MSLTHTAHMSRNIIKFGGIGIVAIVILWSVTKIAYRAYLTANPPYYPPTVKYGILPKVVFTEKQTEVKNFVFELANDRIPVFSDQMKVYVIYKPITTFLALDEDTKTAENFGFIERPREIKDGIYEFKNNNTNKTLTVNVLDGHFQMSYPYLTDQLLLTPDEVPNKEKAISIASSFLSAGNKFTDDLKNGDKVVSFWKISEGGLKSVESQSEANAVRVDFFRESFDEVKLLSSSFNKASVSVLISGSKTEAKKIIEFNLKDISIGRGAESYSTYPIKTTQEAINSLNSGNYWPAVDVEKKEVVIRKIYLAYFEPNTLTNFLQPIYVFEGDDGFVAYVPAIKSEWLQ